MKKKKRKNSQLPANQPMALTLLELANAFKKYKSKLKSELKAYSGMAFFSLFLLVVVFVYLVVVVIVVAARVLLPTFTSAAAAAAFECNSKKTDANT